MFRRLATIFFAGLLCGACGSSENAPAPGGTQAPTGTAAGASPASSGAAGSTKPASGPAPAGASKLVYVDIDAEKKPVRVEVTGNAIARQLRDGRFMIYVYSTDIDPPPTCDNLNPASKHASKGAEIGVVIYDFPGKVGKIKAKEVFIDYRKANGLVESVDNLHGPDVDVTSLDGKVLKATVVTPDPPGEDVPRVDGTVVATVCDPQK